MNRACSPLCGCMEVYDLLEKTHTCEASCNALCTAGAAFLMWELSTPFVYMRWFLFTLGKAESKAYIINGLLMVGTFFVARNVFGTCARPPLPYPL